MMDSSALSAREPGLDDYRKMIEHARYCVEHDYDNEALDILYKVFGRFSNPSTQEDTDIYLDAIQVLFDLRQTDNEFIWERTSYYVADYFDWLQSKE